MPSERSLDRRLIPVGLCRGSKREQSSHESIRFTLCPEPGGGAGKEALLADSLLAFIHEVSVVERGLGMVSADSVKGVVEYVKANHEVQIRKRALSEQEKDALLKRESDRLKVVEV